MVDSQTLTRLDVYTIAGSALHGCTREDILGLLSFLTDREDYWFQGEEIAATWQSNEDGDPVALRITCDRTRTALDFDYFDAGDRQEVKWMIEMLKDWLNKGYGLDW